MTATLSLTDPPFESWEPVRLDSDQTFEVLVRAPGIGDQLRDQELLLGQYAESAGHRAEHRLRATIVNWREIEGPDAAAIPFSWDNLTAVVSRYPAVFRQIMLLANSAFSGYPVRKNSESPAADGSAAGESETPGPTTTELPNS